MLKIGQKITWKHGYTAQQIEDIYQSINRSASYVTYQELARGECFKVKREALLFDEVVQVETQRNTSCVIPLEYITGYNVELLGKPL